MNIDVLIPVASESKFIRDAVQSVAQQSANKRVFILENNIGKKEYSQYLMQLAKEFAAEYVYFDIRLPMFKNWQRCLNVGNFDWIAFLHDDDVWSPNYLETASELEHVSDIMFFEYTYFEGVQLEMKRPHKAVITTLESREKLLAKMIDAYQHVSSTIFRRSLNLTFPTTNFKMVADQYAYRECVAIHKTIRVSWVDTGCPNGIRMHPNQGTWSGALLYAGVENAISYRRLVANLDNESINIKEFCSELANRYAEIQLSRIISAILFRQPYILTTTIAMRTFVAKRSIWLIVITLVRSIAQELVWTAKIFFARYRSGA